MPPRTPLVVSRHGQRRAAERARRVRRRRAALGGVAAVALLAGIAAGDAADDGGEAGSQAEEPARAARRPPPELPRGGRRLFPDFRVVAYYGAPQDPQLGALGVGTPAQAVSRLRRQARPYVRRTRPVLPALELIATVVHAAPGRDGRYRQRQPDAVVARYLRAARAARALLVLDIQPGRSDFETEARHFRRWLREPDVGIALDPEWRMAAGELPGRVIGSVSAREINATSAYVAAIVARHDLPEKLFLVHQFTSAMVRDKHAVKRRPGLAVTFNVDGFGDQPNKKAKYRAFTSESVRFHDGFKLFYEEDTDLMTPTDVMRLRPRPDVVVYE